MVGIPTTLFCGVYINEEKIKYIGIVLVILFCCYNLFWYFGSYKPYNEFQKDFPEIEESGVKIYTDKMDSSIVCLSLIICFGMEILR